MINQQDLAAGLGTLALQLRQAINEAEIGAYHLVLGDATDGAEFRAFVQVAVRRFGWRYFPSVPELLDALQEFRGRAPLNREAVDAYEAVCATRNYNAVSGAVWDYRSVLARCGRAAAEAFVAAGADSAFRTSWQEDKRRERFIAAYTTAARAEPLYRLLPAAGSGTTPGLPPGPEVSAVEAPALLLKVAAVAGEFVQRAAQSGGGPASAKARTPFRGEPKR